MDYQTRPSSQFQTFGDRHLGLGSIAEEHAHLLTEDHAHLPPNKRPRFHYECRACGTTYTEKRALARHRHTDMHRRRLGLQPDKRHLCLKCGRSFGRNHDLQRHRREQHGEATGASPIDLSSVASVASEASDNPPWSSIERETGRRRSGSIDCLRPPIDPEASSSHAYNAWPSEPADVGYGTRGTIEPLSKQPGDPPRWHSSAGLRGNNVPQPPTVNVSQPESVSSPSSSRSRQTSSQPTLWEESSRSSADDADHVNEQSPTPPPKPPNKQSRAAVLASAVSSPAREVETWLAMECKICAQRHEDDASLITHLYDHLETSFKGKHQCKKCDVGFDHEEDLQKHLDSAAKGHCGFNFDHMNPCTGHHPQVEGGEEGRLSDPDCFRLWQQLRNWEQAQLRVYIQDVNRLVAARDGRGKNRWSVEAFFRHSKRNSSHSCSSFAVSVNTYASAPCDETNGDMDINGLQKRMRLLSLRGVGSSVKNIWGGSKYYLTKAPPPPSQTYDKALFRAIHRGELDKAEAVLNAGPAGASLNRASGSLAAAALWDAGEVQSMIVAHRLNEDIQGSCDTCNMNSQTFQKGSNKVKALLAHGANPCQAGGLCGCPIHSAAWMCNGVIVGLLLQHGACVNQRDKDGKFGSPLAVAASQAGHPGSLEVVEVLLKAHADVNISGSKGSPLHLARKRMEFWEQQSAGQAPHLGNPEVAARVECCKQIIRALELAGARR